MNDTAHLSMDSTKLERGARILRQAILRGELQPGQQLKQQELAAHLGMSSTPIREVLHTLEAEGLSRCLCQEAQLRLPFHNLLGLRILYAPQHDRASVAQVCDQPLVGDIWVRSETLQQHRGIIEAIGSVTRIARLD